MSCVQIKVNNIPTMGYSGIRGAYSSIRLSSAWNLDQIPQLRCFHARPAYQSKSVTDSMEH